MNRIVSKITLVVLVGFGLQAQAISSWVKGAAALASTIGAYTLYLRNQNITVHQNIVDKDYLSLINDIKISIKYNLRLDTQLRDRLEKLAIYPGAQLNAGIEDQDHRNFQLIGLVKIYNICDPMSKEQSEAGKKLLDTLADLRTNKLKELSFAKSVSGAFLSLVYGIGNQICGLFSSN